MISFVVVRSVSRYLGACVGEDAQPAKRVSVDLQNRGPDYAEFASDIDLRRILTCSATGRGTE